MYWYPFYTKQTAWIKKSSQHLCMRQRPSRTTHLKSSPLFTFSTKSLGQDSPSIHLFSKIIRSRFTAAKIKLGEDSPSWFVVSTILYETVGTLYNKNSVPRSPKSMLSKIVHWEWIRGMCIPTLLGGGGRGKTHA